MSSDETIINIWELGPNINVRVKKQFLTLINDEIIKKFKTKRKIYEKVKTHIPFSTFKARLKLSYPFFIDLEILVNLCNLLLIPLEELQRNITKYKIKKSNNYVNTPKLPIKLTPIFDMLIAHHIGDGFVVRSKERIPYFGYKQLDKELRISYLDKIESLFGKIKFKKDYQLKSKQIYCPAIFTYLFFNHCQTDEKGFLSGSARIPDKVKGKRDDNLLAVLLGFIIDEGYVDSTNIVIRVKNKLLAEDIYSISKKLGYKSKISLTKDSMWNVYVLKEGLLNLHKDLINLKKNYPFITLGYKERLMEDVVGRSTKPKRYVAGNKEKILNILTERELSAKEIAKELNMTRQGAGYLIRELLKEDKIKIHSIIKDNRRYTLKC